MTFETRLRDAQRAVEADLAARLDAMTEPPARLTLAIRHGLLGGGKRFRPFLVLEGARLFKAPARAALTVASALEAIHCYSLVHDDLPAMDDDRVRRGAPTVWAAFDDWTAILTGDALLTLAFEWIAAPDAGLDPGVLGPLVAALAIAAGPAGMVGGQALDLAADKLGDPVAPTVGHVQRLQAMKTGALIRFACRAGPMLAGAPAADIEAMASFGEALGLAFQITDDLLDASGDAAVVGKALAKDAAAGKATLVSLYGVDGARAALEDSQRRARSALTRYGDRAAALSAAVDFVGRREK